MQPLLAKAKRAFPQSTVEMGSVTWWWTEANFVSRGRKMRGNAVVDGMDMRILVQLGVEDG